MLLAKRLVTLFTFGWALASTVWAFSRTYSKETTEQIAVIQTTVQSIEKRMEVLESKTERINEKLWVRGDAK